MEQILGSVANMLLGVPGERQPTYLSEHRTAFVPQPGQIAYGYTFDWAAALGDHRRVCVGYYATQKEADLALASALKGAGYEEPRWWQFWRWGSHKLPAEVSRLVSEPKPMAVK